MSTGDETMTEGGADTPPLPVGPEREQVVDADVGTPAPIRPIESVMREITVDDIADVVALIARTVSATHPQPVQVYPNIPASPNHLVNGGGS